MALSASAAIPFEKGKTAPAPRAKVAHAAPSRAVESQLLLDEKFDKFTDGTESAPAADEIFENGYHIPDSYTAQPGWTGRGVHAAGGCVALYGYSYYDDYYEETINRNGYLTTPKFMLSGTATFTFRAKALDASGASLWVAVCDDDYGPGSDSEDYALTDQWQEFTLVATEASLDMPSYIQCTAERGVVLLDDVRLEFRNDRLATPYALPAINKSATEFEACWEEVPGAAAYRLNVLCYEKSANPVSGEVFQNFDGINVNADGTTINAANPGYPAGWTFDLAAGTQQVATDAGNYNSPSVAIKFDAEGDMIETETIPYPVDGLEFWVKASQTQDSEYDMSLLRVELFHSTTGNWEPIAHIPYYYLPDPSGCVYKFPKESLGSDVTKVRLVMIQRGLVDFFIDDLRIHYTEGGTTSFLIKDRDLATTKYTVSDINPVNEYSYYVQAVNGDIISSPSYVVWVDGIVGLKVETEEVTDATPTSFTASWKQLGHATDYKVETFKVFTPAADTKDVVVLEESFDKITEGTVDNPGYDWVSPFDFGAKGWTATAWGATQPRWAAGMAGTGGTSYIGQAGLVYTPALDLSCHTQGGIKVEATVVTTVGSFDYTGQEEPEGMFALILRSPSDTQPIASGFMDTPVVGSNSGVMHINNIPADADLSNVIIAFMNKSGTQFFVDHAKITMDVAAGKTLMTPLAVANTQETSLKLEGLDPAADHAFAVTASASRDYVPYVSDPSDIRVVKTSAGVDNVAVDADNAPAEYFNLNGIRVNTDALTPGLYIKRHGNSATKIIVK